MSRTGVIPEREVIGPPDCPLMHRWEVQAGGAKGVKLMVHHFLPNADDRDVHDHPRPFWTFVLRGFYDDLKVCPICEGTGIEAEPWICKTCGGDGVILNERMRPGMLRRRAARHAHRTKVGPNGCWTVVLMGPIQRRWGFWRGGQWWFWRDYEAEFGFAMRCEDLDKEYRK